MSRFNKNKPLLKSLNSKIFVYFTLLFSFSLAVILMVELFGIPNTSNHGSIRNNEMNALKQLNIIADLEKDRVTEWLQERKKLAKVLAKNSLLQEGIADLFSLQQKHSVHASHKFEHIRSHFHQIISLHPIYDSISIVNINSKKVILSNHKNAEGLNFKDLKVLDGIKKSGVYETVLVIENIETEMHDLLIMRKLELSSVDNVYLMMQIDTDKIIQPLLQMGNMLGQTADVVVLNENRQVLFALKHRLTDGRYGPTAKAASMAANGEEGFSFNKDYRGVDVMTAYRHIMITSDLAWSLVVKQDYEEIKLPLTTAIFSVLSSAALILVIALVLIYIISKKLTYPLNRLSRAISQVKKGNISERALIYSHDDIGHIGLAFNDMLDEIESQQQQLNNRVVNLDHTIEQNEEQIHELAFFDALTQLPNRSLLIDRLDNSIARAERNKSVIVLLLLDLDDFKSVNESIHYQAGDQLLQKTAKQISHLVREEDTVARISSDEFVVLLEDLEIQKDAAVKNAEKIALKIQQEIAKPVFIQDQEVTVSISVGIVVFPDDGQSSTELLKALDIALFRAKALGRENIQFFEPQMKLIAEQRLAIETSLRHAISEQQFELYYQPQVDVNSGAVIGAEALIRWNHPVEGLVSPDRFIPISEETQLIIPIGTWVLQSACLQIKQWEEAGYFSAHLKTVAVNVSAIQFQQNDFVEIVQKVIQTTNISPSHLEIELTESLFMGDYEQTLLTLNKLKNLGLCLTIDDFGTGYSSLSYLKTFPVDMLKIDRSFIIDIVTDSNDAAIVKAIAVMAKSLKLTVLAEGIETEEQLSFIKKEGCDVYQGYLCSKPVNAMKMAMLFTKK